MYPKLIMMVGIAGAGKSEKARSIVKEINGIIISSDSIREELYGTASIIGDNKEVFSILQKRVKYALTYGYNVIYDATNLSMKRRMSFLKEISDIQCYKICVIVVTPYEICVSRQNERNRVVPTEAIIRQLKSFQCPYYYEGWDKIEVDHGCDESELRDISSEYMNLLRTEHDNPHHKYTIGAHMFNAFCLSLKVEKYKNDHIFHIAAALHDIGKGFCKSFVNSKGEKTDIAHYYCHQNVGAYMILSCNDTKKFSINEEERLILAILVQWHMEPFLRNDKSLKKFYNIIDKAETCNKLSELIDALHFVDKMAH